VSFVARGAPGYLGPYRLLNVVHTGHGSQIWQAYDDAMQRLVGVKTLRESADRDPEHLRLLRQEYIVGRDIKDPRIIEMYAFGWDRGQPYLGMEWLSAPNMKQRLMQGWDKISPLIPKIIDQAAEALDCFNRLGWVHRDIKPDNFLVTDDGSVKLIDFALAKRRRRGLMKWFTPRLKIQQGTKSYMSPEQIRGLPLDERSDLYSFACTIHELVSGKPPFTGMSVNDLLTKHLKTAPPTLEALNPNVTPAFAQLLRRSMAKKANARPETVGDFLREFRMIRVFRSMPTVNS
jgi:serine/threonine protein kinase